MNQQLVEYIESEIIPRYAGFDEAHRVDHARTVIEESLKLARIAGQAGNDKGEAINIDMVYAIAAYHDTGLCEGREKHHLVSGRIIREDGTLRRWFTEDQIETMAQAAEDPHYPELDRQQHWERMCAHLKEKYDYGGYLKLWIPGSSNAARLEEFRQNLRRPGWLQNLFDQYFPE